MFEEAFFKCFITSAETGITDIGIRLFFFKSGTLQGYHAQVLTHYVDLKEELFKRVDTRHNWSLGGKYL